MPPHLAGRESELGRLRSLVDRVAGRSAHHAEILVFGPRGNGKTVLLARIAEEAASDTQVDVVRLRPSQIHDRTAFADALLRRKWWVRYLPSQLSVGGTGASWGGREERPPTVEDVLRTRVRRKPLVLLLDEAHTLDPGLGRDLLNASEQAGRRLPFLLVLAGTPNLLAHLSTMGASFWSRAEQMRIGRLTEAATADALWKPFEEARVSVSEDALDLMVAMSQCYPYFVQLLGQAVWRASAALSPGGGQRVTRREVGLARSEFDEARDEYYSVRYREFEERDLLPTVKAVACAFEDRAILTDREMAEAIRRGSGTEDHADVLAIRRSLADLGAIWEPRGRPLWEPGIPSLMDYVRAYEPG